MIFFVGISFVLAAMTVYLFEMFLFDTGYVYFMAIALALY